VARCVAAALTAHEFEVAPDDVIVELKSFSQRDWHHHADLMVYVLAHRFPHRSGREEQYAEAITEALLEHFTLAVDIYGEALASRQMRKIAIKYAKLHPAGPEVWREFIAVKNQKEWEEVLARHYTVDGPGVRVGSVPDAEDVCKVSCETTG